MTEAENLSDLKSFGQSQLAHNLPLCIKYFTRESEREKGGAKTWNFEHVIRNIQALSL